MTVVLPESCGPMTITLSGSQRSHSALKLLCWWWRTAAGFMSTAATPFNGVVVAIQVCFLRLDRLPMLETGEEARRLTEKCLLFFAFYVTSCFSERK